MVVLKISVRKWSANGPVDEIQSKTEKYHKQQKRSFLREYKTKWPWMKNDELKSVTES